MPHPRDAEALLEDSQEDREEEEKRLQPSPPPQPRVEKISNMEVQSKFQMEDIECVDFLPNEREQRQHFKYYCPICLRYFSHILQSQCCKNYICHFCVDDLQQ